MFHVSCSDQSVSGIAGEDLACVAEMYFCQMLVFIVGDVLLTRVHCVICMITWLVEGKFLQLVTWLSD